jgi:hypothetical protein
MEENKNAVIILTRGYDTIEKYSDLIKRNKLIEYINEKKIDYLIFHEGNIPIEHQEYIQNETKNLKLIFINVRDEFKYEFKDNYNKIEDNPWFSLGFRNMCNFWFVSFWKYVEKYEKIIRIDEDCFINFDFRIIFDLLDNKKIVYGKWQEEQYFVTAMLRVFTKDFMKNNNTIIDMTKRHPGGPYTNLIGLNLIELKKEKLLNIYIEAIKESDNIYIHRWGDLPLWGEVLTYMMNEENDALISKDIKYIHGSHNYRVNC